MGSDQADEGVIQRALAEAGYAADGAPLRPEFRRWRWVAALPGHRIAFYADDPRPRSEWGRSGRSSSSSAVGSTTSRCPRSSASPPTVASRCDAWSRARRCRAATAETVRSVRPRWVNGSPTSWAAPSPSYTEASRPPRPKRWACRRGSRSVPPPTSCAERLPGRLPDPALEPVLDAAMDAYAALDEEDVGHVLTHGDVGLHNYAVDPGAGRLVGIFDFEGAALGDQHIDLYGLHSYEDTFLGRALDAYAAESACGRRRGGRRCITCAARSTASRTSWTRATPTGSAASSAGCATRSPAARPAPRATAEGGAVSPAGTRISD